MTFPDAAVRLVLQRQHRADLPGRRPHRQALPLQGPPVGPRPDREHLHDVLGRVPRHRAGEPQRAAALPGRRQRPRELGLAVRQGPLRLRGGEQRRPPARAAGAQGRRARRGRRGRRRSRAAADAISKALADGGPSSVAVIGGARGTNEDAYAWAKLAKGVIGTDNVDAQLGDGLDPAVLFSPAPGHDRRGGARHHGRAARPRPEGRAARPVPAPPRLGRAPADEAPRAEHPRHRADAVRVEEPAPPARRAGRRSVRALVAGGRLPDGTGLSDADVADVPRAARPRARSWSSAGRAVGRRVVRLRRGRPRRSARRGAGGHVPARAAPRQRPRRPRAGSDARACCPAAFALDDAGDALRAAWPSMPGRRRARRRRHPAGRRRRPASAASSCSAPIP